MRGQIELLGITHGRRVISHTSMYIYSPITTQGESLDAITDTINNIHDMSTQIATAVEEQSSVSEAINRSVITIRDIAENALDQAGTDEKENSEMTSLSQSLDDLARRFRDKCKAY